MYDYDYSYPSVTDDPTGGGFLAGIGMGMMLLYLAVLVVLLVANWKIFTKAGKPGWAALIPIYNIVVLFEIVGRPLWWVLLMFIPFVNIVVAVIVMNDLAKSFGKDMAWTLGLIFLPFIFEPLLAFGSAKYHGPAAAPKK